MSLAVDVLRGGLVAFFGTGAVGAATHALSSSSSSASFARSAADSFVLQSLFILIHTMCLRNLSKISISCRELNQVFCCCMRDASKIS